MRVLVSALLGFLSMMVLFCPEANALNHDPKIFPYLFLPPPVFRVASYFPRKWKQLRVVCFALKVGIAEVVLQRTQSCSLAARKTEQ